MFEIFLFYGIIWGHRNLPVWVNCYRAFHTKWEMWKKNAPLIFGAFFFIKKEKTWVVRGQSSMCITRFQHLNLKDRTEFVRMRFIFSIHKFSVYLSQIDHQKINNFFPKFYHILTKALSVQPTLRDLELSISWLFNIV